MDTAVYGVILFAVIFGTLVAAALQAIGFAMFSGLKAPQRPSYKALLGVWVIASIGVFVFGYLFRVIDLLPSALMPTADLATDWMAFYQTLIALFLGAVVVYFLVILLAPLVATVAVTKVSWRQAALSLTLIYALICIPPVLMAVVVLNGSGEPTNPSGRSANGAQAPTVSTVGEDTAQAAVSASTAQDSPCPSGQELREERYDPTSIKAQGCVGTDSENNDRRQGHWEFFYPSGQKEGEGSYVDGFQGGETGNTGILMDGREGLWVLWHENGQKLQEGSYRDGKGEGLFTRWHENGQKEQEFTNRDGKTEGLFTAWHENGQKLQEGSYRDGELEGLSTVWYENGQKWSEATFLNGTITSGTEWDENGNQIEAPPEEITASVARGREEQAREAALARVQAAGATEVTMFGRVACGGNPTRCSVGASGAWFAQMSASGRAILMRCEDGGACRVDGWVLPTQEIVFVDNAGGL